MQIDNQLLERIRAIPLPMAIAVSGFGGAGKSSFSARLGQHLGAAVISVDSFIKSRQLVSYDLWEWIDYDRLEHEVLTPLLSGCTSIEFGHFDWHANAVASRTGFHDCKRVIVEGVGLLRPSLLRHFAFSIWIDCPIEEAIGRGKRRDREVHGNPQDESWDGIWRRNDEEFYTLNRPDRLVDYVFDNSITEACSSSRESRPQPS